MSAPIVLVTGANKGIGYEAARQLAERDCAVWLTARDRARGEALKKASQKGLRAARAFAKYLTTEETVRVTDENAFGVPVTIRASLGKALRDMDTALSPLA